MDKLEDLRGIGRATAERLAKAGIDTFAKLAAATDEQLQAVANLPGDLAAWSKWREEARQRGGAPRPMTDEELAALVRQWDDARAALKAAGDAVAAHQAKEDAPSEEVEAAQAKVAEAEATMKALAPLPEGVVLPPASANKNTQGSGPASPAHSSPAPHQAQGTNTSPTPSGQGGGAPAASAMAPDQLDGVCHTHVRWQGETHGPGTPLTLPAAIARELAADGAFLLS